MSRSGAFTSRSVTGEGFLPLPGTRLYLFYCLEHHGAIELSGGVHSQPSLMRRDAAKGDNLRTLGLGLRPIANGWLIEDAEELVSRVQEATR